MSPDPLTTAKKAALSRVLALGPIVLDTIEKGRKCNICDQDQEDRCRMLIESAKQMLELFGQPAKGTN